MRGVGQFEPTPTSPPATQPAPPSANLRTLRAENSLACATILIGGSVIRNHTYLTQNNHPPQFLIVNFKGVLAAFSACCATKGVRLERIDWSSFDKTSHSAEKRPSFVRASRMGHPPRRFAIVARGGMPKRRPISRQTRHGGARSNRQLPARLEITCN
jgi:hypothetical protein